MCVLSRSRWPRGLRLGFLAACFLGLRVRILPGAEMSLSLSLAIVVCCQMQVSAKGRSLVQRSPTEWVVSECDHETLTTKRPWPTRGLSSRI